MSKTLENILYLLIFFLLSQFVNIQAQQSPLDSLQNLLKGHPAKDTTRVNILNALALQTIYADIQKGRNLAGEALQLASQLNYPYGKSLAFQRIGFSYNQEGNNKQALSYVLKSAAIATQLKNPDLSARVLNFLCIIYRLDGDYPHALESGLNALKWSEQTNTPKLTSDVLISLAILYSSAGDYEQSLIYAQKAYVLAQKTGNNSYIALMSNNLGEVYRLSERYTEAINSYQQALQLVAKEKETSKAKICIYESNLSDVYEKQGNYALAFQFGFSALKVSEDLNKQELVAWASEIIARAYLHTNKPDLAIHHALRSSQIAKEAGLNEYIRDAARTLSQIYARQGNYPEAYRQHLLYTSYKDSISNQLTARQLALQQYNYKLGKKEAEITSLRLEKKLQIEKAQTQQQLLYAVVASLIMFLILAGVLWRNNRHKQRAFLLLKQQKQETDNQRTKTEEALEELKAAQSQLIQQEKMTSLGELTAGIAHEIQNPLNFVNNFSEVNAELIAELKSELLADNKPQVLLIAKEIEENEKKIIHHGKRADAIIKGMLQHSRSTTGQKEPTDINALVDEYLRLCLHGLRAKDKSFNVATQTNFDDTIGKINIVPQDMGRVLLNLFNNGFYSVAEKKKKPLPPSDGGAKNINQNEYEPTITVNTKAAPLAGGCLGVEISVKDNGSGIPPKILDKIFQPFFTTKPTGQGTGLGLSLAFDIITKEHGGKLRVETKEGEGAEFIIQLPIK